MSQRKAAAEVMLEKLETWLGRGARMLEILTVKVDLIFNPTVKHTALEDINEMRKIIRDGQSAINWVIKTLKL